MKKLLLLICALSVVLILLGYQAFSISLHTEDSHNISDLIIEDDRCDYIILPISQKKAELSSKTIIPDLANIDLAQLEQAETKLLEQINSYHDREEPLFHIYQHDGQIGLSVELIVYMDPPTFHPTGPLATDPRYMYGGCGIDHDHLFFFEVISKTDDS